MFLIDNLKLGALAIVLSSAILAIYWLVGVMPRILLIGGMLGIPVGVLLMVKTWDWGCVGCRKPLFPGSVKPSVVVRERILAALRVQAPEGVAAVLNDREAWGSETFYLRYDYCKRCRATLRVFPPGGGRAVAFAGHQAAALLDRLGEHDSRGSGH